MNDVITTFGFINPNYCRMYHTVAYEFSLPPDLLSRVIAGLAQSVLLGAPIRAADVVREAATQQGRLIDEAMLHRITDSIEYLADVLATHIMNTVDINSLDFLKPVGMMIVFDTICVKLHLRFSDV